MEGLDLVKFIIRENDWMVKVDLKDAYFTVLLPMNIKNFYVSFGKGDFINMYVSPLAYARRPACSPRF